MRKTIALFVAAGLGCGRGESSVQSNFQLQLASEDGSNPSSGAARLEMQAGNTLAVQTLVVGTVPGPVTFTAEGLPSFAVQKGSLLTLSPGRADAGKYSFTLTATSRGMSSSVAVDLVVGRFNQAPRWVDVSWTAYLSDDKGYRGPGACPSPTTCTVHGAAHISLGTVADDDGDALHADVEVVPHGQPFTGTPTFSSAIGADGLVMVTFAGLAAGTTYDFAVRVADAFGAISKPAFSRDGWVTWTQWGFEQGPCTGTQCACLPAGGIMCGVDSDCCSGVCAGDSAVPPGWGRCQ